MGVARPVLKANGTILCQDCSAQTEEPVPVIAHQPHEADLMLGPFAKRKREPQAAKLEARPLVSTPTWTPAFPRQKDFSTCIPLNQEDPDISTQLM